MAIYLCSSLTQNPETVLYMSCYLLLLCDSFFCILTVFKKKILLFSRQDNHVRVLFPKLVKQLDKYKKADKFYFEMINGIAFKCTF